MTKDQRGAVSVMIVRSDGSVACRRGELTATAGLIVVAEWASCESGEATRHVHRRWRIQTTSGYLVGDMSLSSRIDAHDAAAALGGLQIEWNDPALALWFEPKVRSAALVVLARWGLTRAAA
jgi:hypothetical protein